jgi:hypothetical protein
LNLIDLIERSLHPAFVTTSALEGQSWSVVRHMVEMLLLTKDQVLLREVTADDIGLKVLHEPTGEGQRFEYICPHSLF